MKLVDIYHFMLCKKLTRKSSGYRLIYAKFLVVTGVVIAETIKHLPENGVVIDIDCFCTIKLLWFPGNHSGYRKRKTGQKNFVCEVLTHAYPAASVK